MYSWGEGNILLFLPSPETCLATHPSLLHLSSTTPHDKSHTSISESLFLLSQDLHPILASLKLSSLLSEFFFHLPGDQSDSLWSMTSRNSNIFFKYRQKNNSISWRRGHLGQTKTLSKYQKKINPSKRNRLFLILQLIVKWSQ